jgi:hypothetical protein
MLTPVDRNLIEQVFIDKHHIAGIGCLLNLPDRPLHGRCRGRGEATLKVF